MSAERSLSSKHLSAHLIASKSAAQAYPELPSLIEQTILLTAMAISDEVGYVHLHDWAEITGIPRKTLVRYARAFADFGFVRADLSDDSTIIVEKMTFQRWDREVSH